MSDPTMPDTSDGPFDIPRPNPNPYTGPYTGPSTDGGDSMPDTTH